jgi:hypothetical protein
MSRLTHADGQLAATSTLILDASRIEEGPVSLVLTNTGVSSETVVITFCRAGGTARRVARAVLATNEGILIANLPMQGGDCIYGASTNAAAVDYLVMRSTGGPLTITAIDANGAEKQSTAGVSGNQSIAGNQTVTGTLLLGGTAAGGATTAQRLLIKKTGIADNTATDVITVTVPNANHAAALKLTLLSSNGAADAFESSRCAEGLVVIARTAGANAVAVAATLALAQIATVAGGATHTLAYGVSAIAGAVGAVNTFTITVTVDDSGNLGGNQLVVLAELINAEASGVTFAAA